MKIVKEYINEIKIGAGNSGLDSVGVGHSNILSKAYQDLRQLADENNLAFNVPIISGNDRIFIKAAEIFECEVTDLYMMHFKENTKIFLKLRERFGKENDIFNYGNIKNPYTLRFTFQIWKDPDIIYCTHSTSPGEFDVDIFVNKRNSKLFESKAILEIKRGTNKNPLSTIGVGSAVVYAKLDQYISDNFSYSHQQWNDKKGNRIAKLLNLSIDNITKICIYDEIDDDENTPEKEAEKITKYIGFPYSKKFISYGKSYWLWESPSFLLEYNKLDDKLSIYMNRHIYDTVINPPIE